MADTNQPTATQTIDQWDWQNLHVQRSLNHGQFITGKHILLCFGPPKLLQMGGDGLNIPLNGFDDVIDLNSKKDIAFPVGITDSFTLRSDKQWRRIFEIGSDRAYMLPGHASYVASMARILYNGPSLLKTSYAFYGSRMNTLGNSNFGADEPQVDGTAAKLMPQVWEAPGYGDLFFNLSSDLFDMTFGVLAIFQDNKHNTVGSIYMEECAVNGHSLNFDANSPLIVEGTSFTPNRVVPVAVDVTPKTNSRVVWSTGGETVPKSL